MYQKHHKSPFYKPLQFKNIHGLPMLGKFTAGYSTDNYTSPSLKSIKSSSHQPLKFRKSPLMNLQSKCKLANKLRKLVEVVERNKDGPFLPLLSRESLVSVKENTDSKKNA